MRTTSGYSSSAARLILQIAFSVILVPALIATGWANPYLTKQGERPVNVRIATCAVSGGFAHLYTAIENNLFEQLEHVYIRGSGPSLAALMADEIRFLYCAAAATMPSLASGVDVS